MRNSSFKWYITIPLLCLSLLRGYPGGISESFAQHDRLMSENSTDAPMLVISETKFDFGEVDEGSEVSHDFVVKNKGGGELNITKVDPDWGCTVAHFDRAIPPGGEGKITLKLNLKGYNGKVSKTSTVHSNDALANHTPLALTGNVRALIDVRPKDTVSFRGMAEQLAERTIELVGESHPFHFLGIENSIEGKVGHKLETVENGKHYRLRLTNLVKQGSYAGYIVLRTDLPQKNEIKIRINGIIEGAVSVNPGTLLVGKLAGNQPVRSGKITVTGNGNKPFKITKLIHDPNLLTITQTPLSDQTGFSLEVFPQIENVPPRSRQQSLVGIETDVAYDEKMEVQVQVFNLVDAP